MTDEEEDLPVLEEGTDRTTGADRNSNATGSSPVTTGTSGDDAYIAALLRERAGYVADGLKDRVKAVDAELKRVGYSKAELATDELETETPEPARRRAKK